MVMGSEVRTTEQSAALTMASAPPHPALRVLTASSSLEPRGGLVLCPGTGHFSCPSLLHGWSVVPRSYLLS